MSEGNYIHQLEGWLAEVRERSTKLLEERNELEAELAALKARRCETCKSQEEGLSFCSVHQTLMTKAVCCSSWEARP